MRSRRGCRVIVTALGGRSVWQPCPRRGSRIAVAAACPNAWDGRVGSGASAQGRDADMALVGCDGSQWLVGSKRERPSPSKGESLGEELGGMEGLLAPRYALHAVRHELGHSGEPRFGATSRFSI